MAHASTMNTQMRECIQACLECYAVCLETVQHCLTLGGRHAGPDHISLLSSCARICETSASVMLLGSDQHTVTCAACAEICRACADDCRGMADGDELMLACADTCQRCAESCEQMAGVRS